MNVFKTTLLSGIWLLIIAGIPWMPATLYGRDAAVDETRLALNALFEPTLRWDNIETRSRLVCGPAPVYHRFHGMDVIALDPGQAVTVKIPAGERLRVVAPASCDTLADLAFSVSNGTGLHAFRTMPMTADHRNALVDPRMDDPSICRIRLSPNADHCLRIALFISRGESPADPAPFRRVVPMDGAGVHLTRGNIPRRHLFHQIPAGGSRRVTLTGPARIAVETRLAYPAVETRRRIRYFLPLSLDGRPFTVLDFETAPEMADTLFIDGVPRVCGQRRQGIVTIPEGRHCLEINAGEDMLVQVRMQDDPDYLLPSLNRSARQKSMDSLPPEDLIPADDLFPPDREKISRTAADPDAPLSRVADAARQMVQDNAHPRGGLTGAWMMAQRAESKTHDPGPTGLARRLYNGHTFFRNLLPASRPRGTASFHSPVLLSRLKRPRDAHMTVGAQHAGSLDAMLPRVSFLALPDTKTRPLVYKIPVRSAPSRLRIMAAPGNGVHRFFIRFNDHAPMPFVAGPCFELPMQAFRITAAEAGPALMRLGNHGDTASPVGDEPRTPGHPEDANPPANATLPYPTSFIQPAFIEIDLPAGVDTVSLWGQTGTGGGVALQYLDSRPYRMGESEYLTAARAAGSRQHLFEIFAALLVSGPGAANDDDAAGAAHKTWWHKALTSHWTPLVRMIRAHHARFTAGVSPWPPQPSPDPAPADIADLLRQADAMTAAGHTLPALEKYARLTRLSAGKVRRDSAFSMVDLLQTLGEPFLAESLLKQLFLSRDARVSAQAFHRLLGFYNRMEKPPASLVPLYCSRAVISPTAENIRALSQILAETGETFYAMATALLLPRDAHTAQILLKTAGQAEWFRTFTHQVRHVTEPRKEALWKGMNHLYHSRYLQALDAFKTAGEQGITAARAVSTGLEIRKKFVSRNRQTRLQGLAKWETWYGTLPGETHWENSARSVVDYDGAVTLYNSVRDLYMTRFRALPDRPVQFRAYGPRTLKISVRVLHDTTATGPVNGWITLRHNGRVRELPVVDDLPVQGLLPVGGPTRLPGRTITREIQLTPGRNDIAINSPSLVLITKFESRMPPAAFTDMLPERTPALVAAIMAKDAIPTPTVFTERRPPFFHDTLYIVPPRGSRTHANRACVIGPLLNLSPPVRGVPIEGFRRAARNHERRPDADTTNDILPVSAPGALTENPPDDPYTAMAALLKAAQETPAQLLAIETAARRLYADHSHVPGLQKLLFRITMQTTWEPVSMIQADAGILPVPLDRWQPQSRSLRIRKALFPDIFKPEQVVTRNNDLVLFLDNPRPVVIRADLSFLDLPLVPAASLTCFYRLDDQPPVYQVLSAASPRFHFTQPVSTGSHRLTVGIAAGAANQFLRVNFCETAPAGGPCRPLTPAPPSRRYFYTATHGQPVQVNVKGPAVIRIDRRQQGETLVQHRFIEKGWQQLSLTPDPGEFRALFRVHRRVVRSTPAAADVPRSVTIGYDALPAPHAAFTSPPPPEKVWFQDEYTLGTQEDGTWAVTGRYKKPFTLQEDNDTTLQDNRFELAATHYYHDPDLPGYFKTTIMERCRDNGGPTLNLSEDVHYYPRRISAALQLSADLYLQQPDAASLALSSPASGEYAGLFTARLFQKRTLDSKSFHIPSISLWGRLLSLDDLDGYPDHLVDSDIFSTYKGDHRHGMRLSEYFARTPWRDTVWFVKGTVNSNEDFNLFSPDNIKVQAGWKQLLGNLDVDVRFRHALYFSDDDRDRDIRRNHLDLNLLYHHWLPDQRRVNLGVKLSRDLDNNADAVEIFLSWFFSRGRGLTDIRPGDLDFYALRHRDMPRTLNNHFGDAE